MVNAVRLVKTFDADDLDYDLGRLDLSSLIYKITNSDGDLIYVSPAFPKYKAHVYTLDYAEQLRYSDNTVFSLHAGNMQLFIYFPKRFPATLYSILPIMILCTSIVLSMMLRFYYKPIKEIRRKLYTIIGGKEPDAKNSPFTSLSDEIDTLLTETKNLIYLESNAQLLIKEAELNALQSQINPHFLYNTLETIRGQAIENNMPDIEIMTRSLSKMFRYSINSPQAHVTLREELAIVDNYFSIQHMRFGSKFKINLDIDDDCLDCIIPKLTIQPLVENAIFHGLETNENDGFILISAYTTENTLRITVKDNGIGIDEKKLMEINGLLSTKYTKSKKSIGIYNVHARIQLAYGTGYGLSITSFPNVGTTVTLLIPK